ncbi:MAG: glycosyl hydrolase [Candidatus Woesebacteria bacterium]
MKLIHSHPYLLATCVAILLFTVIGVTVAFAYIQTQENPRLGNLFQQESILLAQLPPTPEPVPDFSSIPRMWGAHVGTTPSDIPVFEKLVGKKLPIVATFVHWGNDKVFPEDYVPYLDGKTLLIFWEATDYTVTTPLQPEYNFDAVVSGKWDAYFTEFAAQAAAYGNPVILVPFDEMNSDWTPWSGTINGNNPQKYVAAYRYMHDFFKNAPNVKFGWAVNNDSVPNTPENRFENYYPGNGYVDYIGVDGFNFNEGEWETWNNVFDESLSRLEKYPKPIFIFSTASAEGVQKAEWIHTGLGSEIKKHPNVVGWIWFNEKKEKDWRVNSDPKSLQSFKQVIQELP